MKKLWEKGYSIEDDVATFTVGRDYIDDQQLIYYDCLGNIAHTYMLKEIGFLKESDFQSIKLCLIEILDLLEKNQFCLNCESEDVHTAVEAYVTAKIGDTGKKIHTARSRNDQVALDLRLFCKDKLVELLEANVNFSSVLNTFAKKHEFIPIAGRTHLQIAMPSSLGLWAGAFVESSLDNCKLIEGALDIMDQSPLGAAAGYGTTIAIKRDLTAKILGFSKVQNNCLYVTNSRGKFDAIIQHALVHIMSDLSRLSQDIIFFSLPEISYLSLPEKFCTGSSLMPQKRNPDPLELIRAKAALLQGALISTLEITRSLNSGYSRDLQETKGLLFDSFETTISSLKILTKLLGKIKVNKKECLRSLKSEIFATDHLLKLVQSGQSFRDAYRAVSNTLESVVREDPIANIKEKQHRGATGNLGLEQNESQITTYKSLISDRKTQWEQIKKRLFEL